MVLALAAAFSLFAPLLEAGTAAREPSPPLILVAGAAQATASGSPAPSLPPSAALLGDDPALLGDDPARLLGLDLKQAIERFGLPEAMYAARGAEAWQDDVVFQYQGGFSLFWYAGRVWQVRLSSSYASPAYGVFIGDAPDKIVSLLGQPFMSAEGSYLFNLPGRNYPVRMRAYVKDGKVSDLYVYRADF